jgi:mRNA-degrading endonuclease RelE of RelBE toxin-antitoxin system
VKIEWNPAATALARQYLRDQDGMRVGRYRVVYTVDADLIIIDRVDRVGAD